MASRPTSPRTAQEQEKRLRREIANSNERRRMQSINAGFQFLRSLLPQGDEKLSKVSICISSIFLLIYSCSDKFYDYQKSRTDELYRVI